MIAARKGAIRQHPRIDLNIRPRLQRPNELASWSGERLWQELQDRARQFEDEDDDDDGEIAPNYWNDLVDALARQDVPNVDPFCRLLRDPESEEKWLAIFLADMTGAERVAEAVPLLEPTLHLDADFLLESCGKGFARIGDPEASHLIRETYPCAEEDGFRIYTRAVLGQIKHPDSEAALLALLETEQDPGPRAILCKALRDLFSEAEVPVVLRTIA